MKITRTSQIDGKERTMDLDVTDEQILRYLNGELAQRAFPQLSAPEREFIISGITPVQWEETFGRKEDME